MLLAPLYPSLAQREHRRLWLGIVPYHLAFQVGLVTTGVAAVQLSDSALGVGLVVGAWGLPVLFLPPIGGAIADRHSPRVILLVAQVVLGGSALAVALLSMSGVLAAWHLVVLGLIQGTTYSFFAPSRTAYTAALVDRKLFPDAIAAYSLSEHVTSVVGPAVAGLLLATRGATVGTGYLLIAGLHALVLVLFFRLPDRSPHLGGITGRSLAGRVRDGFRYVSSSPALRGVILLAALVMLLGMPYQRLAPVFAAEVFRTGPEGLGLLLTASGLGSIVGSFTGSRLARSRTPARYQVVLASGVGAAAIAFAVAPGFGVALAAAGCAGLASAAFLVVNYALLVSRAERSMIGRVASLNQLVFALGPLGAIPVAAVADAVGPRGAVGGAALVLVLVCAGVLGQGSRRRGQD